MARWRAAKGKERNASNSNRANPGFEKQLWWRWMR